MYKSRVVDVGALVASAARSALVRTKLEDELESTKRALKAARAAAAHTLQAERGAQNQLSDVSEHLAAAKARITSLTVGACTLTLRPSISPWKKIHFETFLT